MTNFNPINFINRLINQSAAGQKESVDLTPSRNMPGDNLIFKRLASQSAQNQEIIQNVAAQKAAMAMDNLEKSSLMKELLKLPAELKDFLNEQAQSARNQQMRSLDSNSLANRLEVAQLARLIGENSQAASQKLIQIISETARNGGDVKQLKEMMSMFASASGTAALSNEANQTLKNLILLYLPFVPLKENKEDTLDFDIDFFEEMEFGDDGSDGKKGEGSQSVNVMIQTKNFGNINAYLQLAMPNSLTTLIYCEESFPKSMLEKLLAEEAKEINLNSSVITEIVNQKTAPPDNKGQKIKINAHSNVNSYLLLITYSLIRLVVSIDKGLSPN